MRLDWQFRAFPAPGASSRRLVLETRRGPIGHLARYPLRFRAGAVEGLAHMTCDFFVDPGCRGQGERLFAEMCRDVPFVLHLGGAPPVTRIAQRLGFRLVATMETYVRAVCPARWAACLRTLGLRHRPAHLLRDLLEAARLGARAFESLPRPYLAIEPLTAVGPEFDDLWRRVRAAGRVGYVKDAAYVRWRYEREPLDLYRILGARDSNGRLVGYAALKTQAGSGPRPTLEILDLVADPLVPPVLEGLAAEVIAEARRGSAVAVRWSGLDAEAAAALRSLGFVRISRSAPVVMALGDGPFDPGLLGHAEAWRLHHGDTHGAYAE